MTFSKLLAAGAMAIAFATVAQAEEQQAPCACITAPSGAAAIGLVTGAEGDVMMSSQSGFSQPAAGQQFGPNTEFILGCQASAAIQVGTDCNLALQPGSQVSVVALDGNLCVRTQEQNALCGETGSLQSSSGMQAGVPAALPAGIFAGTALIGAAVGAAAGSGSTTIGSGDDPASP